MNDLVAKTVTEWKAPEKIDGPDPRILTMPIIVKALQGKGMQPRTIVGSSKWNFMRKKCYMDAHYKCEICGADCSTRGSMDAHEVFNTDYASGTATFVRLVGICKSCHNFIHAGRMFTMLRRNDALMPRVKVLSIVDHGFKVISEYNNTHDTPIYPYSAIMAGLSMPLTEDELESLIEKYNIKFYRNISKEEGLAPWPAWKMIYDGKEYKTPYADEDNYQMAMKEQHPVNHVNPFSGGVFDEIDSLLREKNG